MYTSNIWAMTFIQLSDTELYDTWDNRALELDVANLNFLDTVQENSSKMTLTGKKFWHWEGILGLFFKIIKHSHFQFINSHAGEKMYV